MKQIHTTKLQWQQPRHGHQSHGRRRGVPGSPAMGQGGGGARQDGGQGSPAVPRRAAGAPWPAQKQPRRAPAAQPGNYGDAAAFRRRWCRNRVGERSGRERRAQGSSLRGSIGRRRAGRRGSTAGGASAANNGGGGRPMALGGGVGARELRWEAEIPFSWSVGQTEVGGWRSTVR